MIHLAKRTDARIPNLLPLTFDLAYCDLVVQ